MPRNIAEKCHALLLGVGQRTGIDSDAFTITVKDAEQIAHRLSTDCDFDAKNIKTLKNKNCSKSEILNQLDALIEKTKGGVDLVIVFFSGHGAKKGNDYYLIANDTKGLENILKGTDFVEKLNKINTNKLLVLLDCCHAAGVVDGNIKLDLTELQQKNNRVVISSCLHDEKSFIGETLSLFTAALANALNGKSIFKANKDSKLRLFDLACYLYATVAKAHNQQHPQFDMLEGNTSNFVIVDFSEGIPEGDSDMPIKNLKSFDKKSVVTLSDEMDKNLVEEFEDKFGYLKQNADFKDSTIKDSTIVTNVNGNVEIKQEVHYHNVIQENYSNKNNKVADKNELFDLVDSSKFAVLFESLSQNKQKFIDYIQYEDEFLANYTDYDKLKQKSFRERLKVFISSSFR